VLGFQVLDGLSEERIMQIAAGFDRLRPYSFTAGLID
jgi:hypothetical protein